jgi:osmotically-inducible protein OsmY
MNTKFAPIAAALAISAGLASTALASGGDDEIRNAGTCTDSSSSKIKVKPDDGRIEVEFEVDQNQTGDTWKVKIRDNDSTAFKGSATTRGASGSFEIERKITDQSGSDAIKASAKNESTGERCSASATI